MNLALAMRSVGTPHCAAVKVVEVEYNYCGTDCAILQLETLLAYTLGILDDGAEDVSVTLLVIDSDSTPQNFFECGNKDVSTIEALMSCFTYIEGLWVLKAIKTGTANCEAACEEVNIESEIRKRIYIKDGCAAIGIADATGEEFECEEFSFTWNNILSAIMGVDGNGTPIFRTMAVDFPEDTCLLDDLTAAYYDCGSGGFAFIISRTGSSAYFGAGYTIVYEQSVDNSTYTPLSEGGNKSAIVDPGTQWVKITITCLEDNSNRVITLGKADAENATFHDYLKYSVDGIFKGYVPLTTTIYAGENGIVTLQSLSPDVNAAFVIIVPPTNLGVATSIDIENIYGGPVVVNVTYEDVENPGCIGGTGAFTIEWIVAPVISLNSYSFCTQNDLDNASPISVNNDFDTYQWYKNGVLLTGETGYELNVATYGVGTYYCRATIHSVTQQSATCTVALYTIDWSPQLRMVSFDQYYFDGAIYHLASNLTGITLEAYDTNDYAGGFPATTLFEWAGYTPPTQDLNQLFANGPGQYYCIITLPGSIGGCAKQTQTLEFAFDISAGLFIWNCLQGNVSSESTMQDVFVIVDNGDETWDVSLQTGKWYDPPTNPTAYNPYTPNGTWSRIMPNAGLIQTGGSSVTVDEPGWYAYKPEAAQTDVIGTGVAQSVVGALVVGQYYEIDSFAALDDFSNVATVIIGTINTSGCVFVATGTTPNNWTHGSVVKSFPNTFTHSLPGPSQQWLPYSLTVTYLSGAVEKTLCCVDGGGTLHNIFDENNAVVGVFNSSTGLVTLVLLDLPDVGEDITATYGINCAFGDGFLFLIS